MTTTAPVSHPEPVETAAGRLSSDGKTLSLPASWRLLSFDEAVEPVSDEGKRIDQSDYLAEGSLPVIDQGEQFIGGYTNDGSKAYRGPLPVIVFGDHTRRVKFIEFRFAIGAQGVKLLRPREGWFPRFFAYLLPTLDLPNRGYSRHYQFVRKLRFPQPPEPEQRRIVAEIEKQFTRLEAGLTALRRVAANLKRYRAAVLKAACEGPWPRTTIADVAEDVRYGTSAKTREDIEGVPVLRMANIFDGRLDFEKLKFLPRSHSEFPDVLLEPGDVLFNRTNSAELVGKTAVYHGNPSPCSFASYLIRVRLKKCYKPDFLSYYLNSVYGRQWIASVVSQQVGQANVNGTKLKALEIPNPPLAEQQQIVAEVERRLSVVDELEAVVESNLKRADRLRQSILQRAFEGKLVSMGSTA